MGAEGLKAEKIVLLKLDRTHTYDISIVPYSRVEGVDVEVGLFFFSPK